MCARNTLNCEQRARNTRALDYLKSKQHKSKGGSIIVIALLAAIVLVVLEIVK